MFEKQNLFYADWRDKHGVRHRKSFPNALDALQYESAHKAAASSSASSSRVG